MLLFQTAGVAAFRASPSNSSERRSARCWRPSLTTTTSTWSTWASSLTSSAVEINTAFTNIHLNKILSVELLWFCECNWIYRCKRCWMLTWKRVWLGLCALSHWFERGGDLSSDLMRRTLMDLCYGCMDACLQCACVCLHTSKSTLHVFECVRVGVSDTPSVRPSQSERAALRWENPETPRDEFDQWTCALHVTYVRVTALAYWTLCRQKRTHVFKWFQWFIPIYWMMCCGRSDWKWFAALKCSN